MTAQLASVWKRGRNYGYRRTSDAPGIWWPSLDSTMIDQLAARAGQRVCWDRGEQRDNIISYPLEPVTTKADLPEAPVSIYPPDLALLVELADICRLADELTDALTCTRWVGQHHIAKAREIANRADRARKTAA